MSAKIFRLGDKIYLEGFSDGALVLRMADRFIFELNLTAYQVLEQTDGIHSTEDISRVMAENYKISEKDALKDVCELYEYLQDRNLVELFVN